MIDSYKEIIKESKLEDEIYKWKLVKENNGVSNLATEHFISEINNLKFGNLAYQMALPVLKGISENSPDKLKEIFICLFDESNDIDARVKNYIESCKKIYKGENQTHQDNRTAATLLTFLNPNNYTFYKSTTYEKYCKLINIKKEKRDKRYSHYLTLLKDLSDHYISKDKELLNLKETFLGEDLCNYDKNNLILAQDILNEVLVKSSDELEYKETISNYSDSDIEDYFQILKEIIKKNNLTDGDKDIVFTCTDSRLNFIVGQRYSFILCNEEDGKFGYIFNTRINDDDFEFEGDPNAYFIHTDDINNVKNNIFGINSSINNELVRSKKSGYLKYDNSIFRKKVFEGIQNEKINSLNNKNEEIMIENIPLNRILFGPPGTGKTFNTINKAIQIVDPEFYQNNHANRDELKKRFNELLITDFDTMDGRIVFTTFHQSMSYEDFVEGIKPEVVNENITYNVSDGIFKKICEIAGYKHSIESEGGEGMLDWSNKQYNDSNFYKMSLGDTQDAEESDIYSYCIKNNCISLGFGATSDFSGLNRENIYKQVKENSDQLFAADALNRLINKMSIGDYVIISNGNLYARALGKITSDYYFDDNTEIEHNHFRNVEWLFTDENIHVSEFLKKRFSQQSIYHIDKSYLKEEYFKSKDKLSSNDKKSYALIIDEINRGNVSSIFGELITLIEDDKRRGNKEQLTVTLPYSKKPFSVPNNLFLIGTMNTADRSVEALDTALRRRFEFEEMLPNSSLLSNITCEGIEFEPLLNAINGRIEKLLDKDHQIGHSYFMNSNNTLSITDLRGIFKNKIMPLLQEYFYGDFGKIGLVLGDSFITENKEKSDFAKFDYDDRDLIDERKVYQLADIDKLEATDFISIYEKSE